MKYSVFYFLFSRIFSNKTERKKFKDLCKAADFHKENIKIHNNYQNLISKRAFKQVPINVLFLVNEKAKWKAQSLYDLMEKSALFSPLIALTIADIQKNLSNEAHRKIIEENYRYFTQKGMKTLVAYDLQKGKALSLRKFNSPIIFYQQPYNLPKIQDMKETSKFALSCYIPYYLPDYKNFELDCDKTFHQNLFRFYVLNKELEEIYKNHLNLNHIDNRNIFGLGHPTLDSITTALENNITDGEYVIYAPHWSICHKNNPNSINISTFNFYGKSILNYAKNHPEIKWFFKPHPTLKDTLLKIGEMTKAEIDDYYAQWEQIGKCCYDSDYIELFCNSRTLITDCGSFLVEYFCTGKPIIHLKSPYCTNIPYPQTQKIFDTFYKVHNADELYMYLEELLEKNNDYKKEERYTVLKKCNFLNSNAAENILNNLTNAITSGEIE